LNTKLRPFHDPDWPTVSAIASARAGTDAPGYEFWVKRRQKFDESRYFRREYVVENERKQIIAYGAVEQTIYLPKYRLTLLSNPQWLKRGAGDLLLDRLTSDLVEAKAITVSCRQYASEIEIVELLKFERSCRGRFVVAAGTQENRRRGDHNLDVCGGTSSRFALCREAVRAYDASPQGRSGARPACAACVQRA
jgi:hypothetical protein